MVRWTLVRRGSAVVLPLAALVLVSCAGGSTADDPAASADDPLSVAEAADRGDGTVRVRGFVVADQQRARLCELLLESFPPQCGGATLDLDGLDDATVALDEQGGVRWTPSPVVVTGSLAGDRLVVAEVDGDTPSP